MRADEVAVIEGELSKTAAALAVARYMAAFEKGTISDEAFASRVRDLQAKATTLRHRRDQAAATREDHDLPAPAIGRLRTVQFRPAEGVQGAARRLPEAGGPGGSSRSSLSVSRC